MILIPSIQPETARSDQTPAASVERATRRRGQPLSVSVSEEHLLRITRMNKAIGGGGKTGRYRIDQIRRHDDDELRLVTLKAVRAEQRADDRYVSEERDFRDVLLGGVL